MAGLLLVPSIASAGGLSVGEQNAVASGTAGASTARADDPGAAWYDPAALADGGGWRFGFSLALAHPSLEARSASPASAWTTPSDPAWLTPPHLDASVAIDRWAAGLAVGVPFGGGVSWPRMWPGATEAVRSNIQVFRVAPFFAWSFGKLKASAGVHVDAARLELQRGLDFIDAQGDVRLDLDGRGAGVDAALYLQARPDLGVGLAYRGRTTLALAGNANFTAHDAFSEKTPDQTASTTMALPETLTLGAHYARGRYRVLADLEWANWSVNDRTVVTFANASTPAAVQDNRWHDTLAVRAGGEYHAGKLVVRAGGYVDPSPVPVAYLSPTSPDSTRLGVTFGGSYQLAPSWTVDVFGEGMALVRRETTNADVMAASYGGDALVFGAGVRFTP
ncbi:MAG: outer membrane protein transport protein [Proteobacteria bacterium]|nr:outer membrane protein transport protein [Pseudomonadota bacterium]